MRVVIIGGGAAGMSTATRLRRLDENAEIIVLEQSNEFAVSNCGLTYYLSGIVKDREQLIGASVEDMRRLYNIDVRLNNEVIAINRNEKTISIKDRDDVPYDKLVITIGAYQLRPDIDGVLSENIFTIRNLESIERIKDYIYGMEAKKVLVVGGGLIGIETAEAFEKLGLKVTIVEASEHVMPGLDPDMAAILENKLSDKGIHLYINKKVIAFDEKEAVLNSEEKIPYDLAIIATGVKPDLKLSVLADLDIGDSGGLVVNEHLQTSDADIYAAGDDTEVINFITNKAERISHAGTAVRQARVIADNLVGIKAKFGKVIGSSIIKCFDLTVAAIGANEKELKDNKIKYQKLHFSGKSHSAYYPGSEPILFKVLFDKNGKILGAQAIGKNGVDKRMDILLSYISRNTDNEDLINAEICYAPPFSSGKDIINEIAGAIDNIVNHRMKLAFCEELFVSQPEEQMIIDVRTPDKFQESHIPGAVNIPLAAIRNNLDAIPHDKKVILYCNRGHRAYLTSCILNQRGFDNIFVLSGGMNLWKEILRNKKIR